MGEKVINAGLITSVIVLLTIFFGNTGSGFFSNLMLFIVAVIVGTPFALIGEKIGSLFDLFTNTEWLRYLGFLIGAFIGIAVGVWLFSNKTEVGFMSSCYKGIGDKKVCQCIYNKIDTYTTQEQIELINNPKYEDKYINILKSCK